MCIVFSGMAIIGLMARPFTVPIGSGSRVIARTGDAKIYWPPWKPLPRFALLRASLRGGN